jgi:hypothetical protein
MDPKQAASALAAPDFGVGANPVLQIDPMAQALLQQGGVGAAKQTKPDDSWIDATHRALHQAWLKSDTTRGPGGVPSVIQSPEGHRYLNICVGPGMCDVYLHRPDQANDYLMKTLGITLGKALGNE